LVLKIKVRIIFISTTFLGKSHSQKLGKLYFSSQFPIHFFIFFSSNIFWTWCNTEFKMSWQIGVSDIKNKNFQRQHKFKSFPHFLWSFYLLFLFNQSHWQNIFESFSNFWVYASCSWNLIKEKLHREKNFLMKYSICFFIFIPFCFMPCLTKCNESTFYK